MISIYLCFSHSVMSDCWWPHGLQHSRLPCSSLTLRACSNSCTLSRWCNPTISSFFVPFSSCLQSFPASGSFLMNWLFTSGGQSIGGSASTSVFLVNIQGLFGVYFLVQSLLLLLSRFSRVQLCATPETAAHQAPGPWDSPGKNTGVGCHFLLQCMKVKSESEVAQSCPTLCDPMDCSLPGSSIHGFSRQEYWSGFPLPSWHKLVDGLYLRS